MKPPGPTEMGPDLPDREEEAPAKLYLPPDVAREREEKIRASLPKVAKITVPINNLFSHLDEPGWGDQCLAVIKEQLVKQGVTKGPCQIVLADHTTLKLPPEVVKVIEDGELGGDDVSNWSRSQRRRLKSMKRKKKNA